MGNCDTAPLPDNAAVTRRVHVAQIQSGEIRLDPRQAHHLRDVLRLKTGDRVSLFDSEGRSADAVIEQCDSELVILHITEVNPGQPCCELVVASALPKGDRADWMIEKLSELGVSRFIPLQTERSVVHPSGKNKLERWERIAIESAKQSRRAGVMRIDELTRLDVLLSAFTPTPQNTGESELTLVLSTVQETQPLILFADQFAGAARITLLIGPEGGWSEDELAHMAHLTHVGLTGTILRIETAATLAAGMVACQLRNAS